MITQSKLHMRGVKDKDKSQSIVEETHRNSVYIEAKFDDQIPEIPIIRYSIQYESGFPLSSMYGILIAIC